jgi:hypothetical protein
MRSSWRFLALLLIATLTTSTLDAQSKIVHRWVLTGIPMPQLKKVLVIAVLENYLIRQEFEDEMERLLAKSGVEGIKSHMVLPPRNEMTEAELKQHIKDSPLDGVLVIRPKAVKKETEEVIVGGAYVPPPGYYSLWPYWETTSSFHSTSSYTRENTIVSAEFNLYNAKDEKLLWSGETDTVYSEDFDKLGKDYAKMLVKQLKRDKVIGHQ